MKTTAPPSRPLEALRELTPARVGLGRSGASMPTEALLAFTLDHARARDAVHAAFDATRLVTELAAPGVEVRTASSQARNRADYLRRPDLGRMLDADSRRALETPDGAGKIAIVIPKDAYARRVPGGAHQSWKVETVCHIPAVAARDVSGVERRDKSRKPIGWESGIGITKNVDVRRRSMLDSVSQIVDLLTA